MKRPAQKAFVLAVGIVVIMLIAGCDEEQNLSSTKSAVKKHQLIAAENTRLKKDLERCNKEIKQQQELLAKCQQQKEALKKQLQENIQERVDSILAAVMEDNAKLRKEIKDLKAQREKLLHQLDLRPKPPEVP